MVLICNSRARTNDKATKLHNVYCTQLLGDVYHIEDQHEQTDSGLEISLLLFVIVQLYFFNINFKVWQIKDELINCVNSVLIPDTLFIV